ncbi:LysR family transcriptional regulator [Hydrogenophaga sp.]|uniref:LysR family transcriptional regulator n=1 Tax=Hydrogenophaga sp. TaxID=1904254 RepID=UPI003D0CABCC
MNIEFRHLRYFLTVAEELHFGRAARRLHISQPPLSQNIRLLEELLGTRLFERNSKLVRLTPAGQTFLPLARGILDRTQEAMHQTRDAGRGMMGRLRVGFVGGTLYRGLPELLARFREEQPGVRLALRELNSQEQLVELSHERLDIGFVHTIQLPGGLSHLLYTREPFLCCMHADHVLARKRRIDLRSLEKEAFVMFTREASPDYYERILAMCTDAGFHPVVTHEARQWHTVVSMVAHDLGVALVPQSIGRAVPPGVVCRPLLASEVRSQTFCVWRTDDACAELAAMLAQVREQARRRVLS